MLGGLFGGGLFGAREEEPNPMTTEDLKRILVEETEPDFDVVVQDESAPSQSNGSGNSKSRGSRASGADSKRILSADFVVDEEAQYTGKVNFYSKLKGYGFIEVSTKDVVPDSVLFVHWSNIVSEDRFPFLIKDMEVAFGIQKCREGDLGISLRAKEVTLPDGDKVCLQEDLDKEKKNFLGGQDLRYTGRLKFYDPKLGFGYIALDPGYDVNLPEGTELRVERAEVNCSGKQPLWMTGLEVEFGIWMTPNGNAKAYNMTLPGGLPVTRAAIENRIDSVDSQRYRGEVQLWNWQQRWGFIKVAQGTKLPPNVEAKLQLQAEQARAKAVSNGKEASTQEELLYFRSGDTKPGSKVQKGSQVTFQVYTDDKGAGAHDIETI